MNVIWQQCSIHKAPNWNNYDYLCARYTHGFGKHWFAYEFMENVLMVILRWFVDILHQVPSDNWLSMTWLINYGNYSCRGSVNILFSRLFLIIFPLKGGCSKISNVNYGKPERFTGLTVSRVPQKISREYKCLSLIILNNKHFWPRQCESISAKTSVGLKTRTFSPVNLFPSMVYTMHPTILDVTLLMVGLLG